MTDLVGFLLARIAEDEATAKDGPFSRADGYRWELTIFEASENFCVEIDTGRVLAECEAKRRIIEWCGEREMVQVRISGDPSTETSFVPGKLAHPADSVVLRFLALPYADHPDYDEAWRPAAHAYQA